MRYLLDLSLSFRFYSVAHNIYFKVQQCPTCVNETVVVWVRTNLLRHTFKAHIVSSEVHTLIGILEQIRFQSHDFNIENFRDS